VENNPLATLPCKTQKPSASTEGLIKQWLFRFGIEHKQDVAPRLPLWLEAFGGLEPSVLESLFKRALKTCKFFPKVSEILAPMDLAENNSEDENASLKWQQVRDAIRLHYSPDLPWRGPKISERTRRAISAAGGLGYLSECIGDDLVFARKRFIESYLRWDELKEDQFLLPAGEISELLGDAAANMTIERLLEAPTLKK
jgi:hypothetical protein